MAVLSLLGLGGKIKCVIDSATFKQNKYTPVTHIPIVSPDKVEGEAVDSIIVVAGSYSDEVVRIASKRFAGIHIAILRGGGLEVLA